MRMTVVWAVGLMLFSTAAAAGDIPLTEVPTGKAPTVDGVLSDGEWKGARKVALSPEGEGYLMCDEKALYVGLRAGTLNIPSLAVLKDGKILIFHASAALGTAVYEADGSTFKATRTFTWRCREGRSTPAEAKQFLADEGWFATKDRGANRGDAEFRIDRRLLMDGETRFAFVVCRLMPGPPTACAWPETVKDGSTDQRLLFGNCPVLTFQPDRWARLAVSRGMGSKETPAEKLAKAVTGLEKSLEKDPRKAYVALLDLLAAAPDSPDVKTALERVSKLRRKLEKNKAVRPEVSGQRRLESTLRWISNNPARRTQAAKKLQEVESRHPGTRAARIAREKREAISGQ